MRRGAIFAAAGLVAAGTCAGTASAALWLVFSRTTAAPREAVAARTAGKGAFARPIRAAVRRSPPRVFLVERSQAQQVRSPTDPRLVELGRLSVDRRGIGRLGFVVPNVPPGDYATLIYCRPCGRYSRGRTLLPAGRFQVTEAAPLIRDCSGSLQSELPETRVSAGPLTLAASEPLSTLGPERFAPISKRPVAYRTIKILAVLQRGATATLEVPLSERRNVALLYRRPILVQGERMRVSDGDAAVTFKACREGEFGPGTGGPTTVWGGGFVVAGARCASLILRVEGRSEPLTLRVPFGASCT